MSDTNREILFRGKRKERDYYGLGGEWIYGMPIQTHIGTFICFEKNPHYCNQYGYMEIEEISKVIPETVGQFTGLTDKNGTKIFEGDIIKGKDRKIFSIEWGEGLGRFIARESKTYNLLLGVNKGTMTNYEVIGSIHDNPELLEGSNGNN